MTRLVRLIACTVALGLCAGCSMPDAPSGTALVFGVATYTEFWNGNPDNSPNLSLTDDDARAMAAMLVRKGWTVAKTGIANSADYSANSQATSRQAIESAIQSLKGTKGPVLFYYSGHGAGGYGNSVLLPHGSVVPNAGYTGYVFDQDALIDREELMAMFDGAGLKNVIIILDCCYSGGFVGAGATADAVPPVYSTKNKSGFIKYSWFVDSTRDTIRAYLAYSADSSHVVLSAAGSGELSWETTTLGHGVFTAAILEAATSRAADSDGDGFITTSELYAYCARFIEAKWNSPGNAEAVFYPHLSGTAREYALWKNDL